MQIPKDSTDITTYFVLRDSATHAPKTDVTVTDIDLYYVSHKTAISSKADATALDAANSAHADNKAFNVGQGIYRIDWPDVWTGAVGTTVNLAVVCSGVDTEYLECEIVGVGQTGDVYAVVAKEATLATVAGYLDTEIADIKAKTDTITTPPTTSQIADAVLEESLADHKTVANSLAKAMLEMNQRLNGAKVVIDADAGTIKVYDTNGTDLLFTLTKTATGNVYTIARS